MEDSNAGQKTKNTDASDTLDLEESHAGSQNVNITSHANREVEDADGHDISHVDREGKNVDETIRGKQNLVAQLDRPINT